VILSTGNVRHVSSRGRVMLPQLLCTGSGLMSQLAASSSGAEGQLV